MIGGLVSCDGLVAVAPVLILIILKFLKLRKRNHMEYSKIRTITTSLGNVLTGTISSDGASNKQKLPLTTLEKIA